VRVAGRSAVDISDAQPWGVRFTVKRHRKSTAATKRSFVREDMDNWLRERPVPLTDGDLDESPMPYRSLEGVPAHHLQQTSHEA
jgi:hypothetical protein